jgi:hypothetical protein
MPTKFTFTVPNDLRATIVKLVAQHCTSLQMETVAEAEPEGRSHTPVHETRSAQAVLKILRSDPGRAWNAEDVGELLATTTRYRPTTATPCLSALVMAGLVSRSGHRGSFTYTVRE